MLEKELCIYFANLVISQCLDVNPLKFLMWEESNKKDRLFGRQRLKGSIVKRERERERVKKN